jgi:hypothetical protein
MPRPAAALPPWIEECAALRCAGVKYRALAARYGVTVGIISGALYRYRGGRDLCTLRAEERFLAILRNRRAAVRRLFENPVDLDPRDKPILLGFAEGCTNRECGDLAGCSHAWANRILRSYGLDPSERFRRTTRERALRKVAGNPDL